MKVLKIFLLLFPVFILIFISCTKIDSPYATVKNVSIKDTIMNWDTIPAIRKVLLEDYTGHKCVNCPDAAITARSLDELHEGKLIIMAVHAGFYAKPDKTGEYTLDLRAKAGEDWNSEFGLSSYPNGLVNRKVSGGSLVIGPDKWGSSVQQIITLPPDFQIKITNQYNSDSRQVSTTIYNRFITELDGEYTLTVCIVEDSIIGAQKNSNPNIGPYPDWFGYVFNDVLRGTLNGSVGEVLTTSPDTELTYLGRYKSTLSADLVAKNCWILAFVSNSATREILQVEKKKIIP
jgi:hypothetical protein